MVPWHGSGALSDILPLISVTHSHLESGRGVRGGMKTASPELGRGDGRSHARSPLSTDVLERFCSQLPCGLALEVMEDKPAVVLRWENGFLHVYSTFSPSSRF